MYSTRSRRFDIVHTPNTPYTVEQLDELQHGVLRVFVSLFSKYRLFFSPEDEPCLDVKRFLEHSRQSYRDFLHSFSAKKSFYIFFAGCRLMAVHDLQRNSKFDYLVIHKLASEFDRIRNVLFFTLLSSLSLSLSLFVHIKKRHYPFVCTNKLYLYGVHYIHQAHLWES